MISDAVARRSGKGTIEIRWQIEKKHTPVSIYAGPSARSIPRDVPVARVRGQTWARIRNLDPGIRHYFWLQPDGGAGIITAERRVDTGGAVNFRDLGGYPTRGGRRTRWGEVFRSDHLSRLDRRDLSLLKQMDIRTVFDLRTQAEAEAAPDRLPEGSSVVHTHLPVVRRNFEPVSAFDRIMAGDTAWLSEDFMIAGYIEHIEYSAHVWGTILSQLRDPGNRPLVFHCTGGKDRAGICAALILLALEVPEETVIEDHGLSNTYNVQRVREINTYLESIGIDPQKLSPYLTAPREAIMALLEHLREKYGGIGPYLHTKAGATEKDRELLKRELLE